MTGGPPRSLMKLAAAVTARLQWPETAMGDLEEEFGQVLRARGRTRAVLWFCIQLLALTWNLARDVAARQRTALATLFFLGDRPMHSFMQEVRVALRSLSRAPLVAVAIVITLALGLGVNAAAFSLLDALVLRPFNFPGLDRLVVISEFSAPNQPPAESVAPGTFYDWQRQATAVDRMAAFAWWQVNLAGDDEPERVTGFTVTPEFFAVLGVVPASGRFFDESDATTERRVVVLGDSLWRRRFGARTDVVGHTVQIDGRAHDIIGIAPARFDFPMGAALWGVEQRTPAALAERRDRSLAVIARLRDGRTLGDARAEIAVIDERLRQQFPREMEGYQVRVQDFTSALIDPGLDQIMLMVQIGALLVLAIGGANIASLLLARGWDRQREVALRLAIGAGRVRIVRQLLVESVALAVVAIPVALGFAWAGLRILKSAMPGRILPFVPGWLQIGIDGRLTIVIIAVAVVAACAFGLLPALQASRPNLLSSLREGGRSIAGGRSGRFVRSTLVVVEIALAVPLLVATSLAVNASEHVTRGPQGYDPAGVTTLRTVLSEATYDDATKRRQFAEDLIAGAERLPGVESVATTTFVPAGNSSSTRTLVVDGAADVQEHRRPYAPYRAVSPRYFATMRIPIVSGRSFESSDTPDTMPVAVVSEALAARLWPNTDALGKRFRLAEGEDTQWMTIVGVAGNIIDDWYDRRNGPIVFVPMAQRPSYSLNLVVRAQADPTALADDLRRVLFGVDRTQPAVYVMTMARLLHERTVGLQMIGAMMGVLGALAVALAFIGLYSLMAYHVTQRRHEIGVRMALGATLSSVVGLTLRRAGSLAAIGIVAGLLPAVLLAGVLQNVIFGVVAASPALYATIVMGILAVAFMASVAPARQAARVDPVGALRGE